LHLTAESAFSDEARLLFYALHSQATKGPCKDGKPWGWNVVESAKWQSWSQLGNMPQMEAMRLYVRTLDEEQVGNGSLCIILAAYQLAGS
jgi:acyl-CoA-binding protein